MTKKQKKVMVDFMAILSLTASWLFGLLFIWFGVIFLTDTLSIGIISLLGGIFFLPPARSFIESKDINLPKYSNLIVGVVIVIVVFALLYATSDQSEDSLGTDEESFTESFDRNTELVEEAYLGCLKVCGSISGGEDLCNEIYSPSMENVPAAEEFYQNLHGISPDNFIEEFTVAESFCDCVSKNNVAYCEKKFGIA